MESLIEKLKEIFSTVSDKIIEFYEENRKMFFAICGLVAVILVCLILLAVTSSKSKKKVDEVPGRSLELTEPLVIPDGPALPREYTPSRKTKENWTNEEAEPWFTVPDQKEIDSLGTANDNLINEIIGAAP